MEKLRELEIIKVALANDMSYQRNRIKQFREYGMETAEVEKWLKETDDLHRRVIGKYWRMKAEEGAE